jgi:hypothetical protein
MTDSELQCQMVTDHAIEVVFKYCCILDHVSAAASDAGGVLWYTGVQWRPSVHVPVAENTMVSAIV